MTPRQLQDLATELFDLLAPPRGSLNRLAADAMNGLATGTPETQKRTMSALADKLRHAAGIAEVLAANLP